VGVATDRKQRGSLVGERHYG